MVTNQTVIDYVLDANMMPQESKKNHAGKWMNWALVYCVKYLTSHNDNCSPASSPRRQNKRRTFYIDPRCHPQTIAVVQTRAKYVCTKIGPSVYRKAYFCYCSVTYNTLLYRLKAGENGVRHLLSVVSLVLQLYRSESGAQATS